MASTQNEEFDNVATEDTPLLLTPSPPKDPADSRRRQVIILCMLILFILEFGAGLLMPGYVAALEQRICRDFYPDQDTTPPRPDHDVEDICKSVEVQGKLATLRGWSTTISCIPGRQSITNDIRALKCLV